MSEWSDDVVGDRIRGCAVQHSDFRVLRQLDGQHTAAPAYGPADIPGTMPNGRRRGKRRGKLRSPGSVDEPGAGKSANMHAESLSSTARSSDMQEDAATPARVASQRPADLQKQAAKRYVSRLTRDTLAVIMAGGRGERLKHLTEHRCKPATPFGGKFRIIDFVLSNCVNSGIRHIAVLTQYKAQSLIQHIQRGWGYLRGEFGEFVEVIPAQQQHRRDWYRGTADAVYQNLDIIRRTARSTCWCWPATTSTRWTTAR